MAKPQAKAGSAKKAAAKKPSKPAQDDDDLAAPEVVGSQQDYERFLDESGALVEREVRPFRLDPSLAYHNVERGVQAVLAFEDRIRAELPTVDVEQLRALPNLALGLCFAASQVDRGAGTSKQLAGPLSEAYALRETMLASAVALALAGLLPKREVEKIQEGRGPLDAAQDCVDLAATFKKHAAAVRGKTPVTAAQVTRAAKLGTDLIKALRPAAAKRDRAPTGALKEALDVRNRFATLLSTRHELLQRVAHWLWGASFDTRVPALQARATTKRKAAKAPAAKKKPEKPTPE